MDLLGAMIVLFASNFASGCWDIVYHSSVVAISGLDSLPKWPMLVVLQRKAPRKLLISVMDVLKRKEVPFRRVDQVACLSERRFAVT